MKFLVPEEVSHKSPLNKEQFTLPLKGVKLRVTGNNEVLRFGMSFNSETSRNLS